MPQLRRPDYQPPQTQAGSVAPRGNLEDGRHVTAASQPGDITAGGSGALPRTPSYRWRTVKGHCMRYQRRWGAMLGLGWGDTIATDLLGTVPLLVQIRKKGTILYLLHAGLFSLSDQDKWQMRSYATWRNTTGSVGWQRLPFSLFSQLL